MISREIQIHKQENSDAKKGNANLKTKKYHVHNQRNTDTQIGKYRYKNREIHFQRQIHKERSTNTPRQSQQGSGQKLLIANVLDGHACVQSEHLQYIDHLINFKQHTTCDMAMTTSE